MSQGVPLAVRQPPVNAFAAARRSAGFTFEINTRGGHMLPLVEPTRVAAILTRYWLAATASST